MLDAAIRIAQRMGIHKESTYAKCTALEAEMRRRLWWLLIIFDHRIAEMSDQTITMLTPTWNCRTTLNVNDFDLRLEMKTPPEVHEKPTEALFAVVRSELNPSLYDNLDGT
jgi:Fungal specific transcription factor domain